MQQITWEEAISEAKILVNHKNGHQLKIAELAFSVCEIVYGGYNDPTLYTVKKFAKEIGVHEKTLSNWMGIYKGVVVKLPPEFENLSYNRCAQIHKLADNNASKKQIETIARELTSNDFDLKMKRYLHDLRGIFRNFEINNAAERCKKETLEEYLFYTKNILNEIKKKNPKLKPIFNNISSVYRLGNGKGISSINEKKPVKIRISQKDQKIINYMKKNKDKWHSPTEIGVKVGKHKYSNASAWAYRTLIKLCGANYAEKNKQGKYKLTRKADTL